MRGWRCSGEIGVLRCAFVFGDLLVLHIDLGLGYRDPFFDFFFFCFFLFFLLLFFFFFVHIFFFVLFVSILLDDSLHHAMDA